MVYIFWDFLMFDRFFFFFFENKWNKAWLFVIKMVYKSYATNSQTTDLRLKSALNLTVNYQSVTAEVEIWWFASN